MESEAILPTSAPDKVAPFDPSAAVPDEYDVLCEGCGYSLVGIQSDRCPECGKVYEPHDLPFARVPWLHRRKIGRVKAFLATFWMVLVRPRHFAEELRRPTRISSADARRFRLASIRIATVGVAGVLAVAASTAMYFEFLQFRRSRHIPYWVIALQAVGAVVIGSTVVVVTYVLFRLATDLPVFIWKGHPSMKETELAPIHCYAAAPLASFILAPILAAGLIMFAVLSDIMSKDWREDIIENIVWGVLGLWVLVILVTTIRLMLGAGVERRRVWMMAAYMPIHWLLMTLLTFMVGGVVVAGEGALLEWIAKTYH